MCQQDLAQVLRQIPSFHDPNLLFGLDTLGDAGIYQLSEEIALVQTVDVLTPIADDPFVFGEIAAANALSDVYVMGAIPITALNIIGFPAKLELSYLSEIIKGGSEKIREAGAVILGGHTIKDDDPKYGLAVTGIVHPQKIITNRGAKPGDVLILTKPIGTGIISTALKADAASDTAIEKINQSMKTLNNVAARTMVELGVNACTDITGFGLLGHALQLAQASGVSLIIEWKEVPIFEEALEYAEQALLPGGTIKNFKFVEPQVEFDAAVNDDWKMILADAQTSGGLLISVEKAKSETLIKLLKNRGVKTARIIGTVCAPMEKSLCVK